EEDNPRPRKKARKEAPKVASEEAREEARGVTREDLEIMFKGVADCMKEGFKKCIREFRKFSDRLEAVEKKVGVTNQVTPPPQDKQPTPLAKETGGTTEANSVYKILPEDKADGVTSKEIVAVTSTDHQPSLASTDQQPSLASTDQQPSLASTEPSDPRKKKDKVAAYNPFPPVNKDKLKELADWLKTDPRLKDKSTTQRYQENPQAFRSERMCFLDHNFSQSWREQYQLFKTSEPDHKGLGRVLPGGAIPSSSVPDAWDAIMEPFLQMVPYLLVECAATDEIRVKCGLEPYKYERPLKGVPTANNGDCGVYAVKYIECHALGV
ncbi:unnamed protein product, partial [Brassica oleracea]